MLANAHIIKTLISSPDPGFEDAYRALTHPDKTTLMPLLIYLDKVWNAMLGRASENELRFSHFHFPEMSGAEKDVILEFIVLKQFFRSLAEDPEQGTYLADQIRDIERAIRQQVPEGLSAKSLAYRKWAAEKESLRKRLKALKMIPDHGKNFLPDTIFNLPQNDMDVLKENWHTIELNDLKELKKRAYSLLNANQSMMQLSRGLQELGRLDSIRRIILFDCEYKKTFHGFNKRMIDGLRDQGYLIKDLIICSFNKRTFRLGKFMDRLNLIYGEYYVPHVEGSNYYNSYIFYEQELEQLIANKPTTIPISWLGERSEAFYDYLELVQEYGIDQLRSIGVLNIYSMALNDLIAQKILNDLFSEELTNDLFADEIRTAVQGLDLQEKDNLRNTIQALLEIVIATWATVTKEIVQKAQGEKVAFVVPFQFLNATNIKIEWQKVFLNLKSKFYAWNAIRDEDIKECMTYILTYKDTGRYPFDLFPNIVENTTVSLKQTYALFMKIFFCERYDRCVYSYLTTFNKLLAHDFRYQYLQWKDVDAWIETKKIVGREVLLEADDHEYGLLAEPKELIRVEYVNKDKISFYPSRQLIIRKKEGILKAARADELLADFNGYAIQPLEDIHEDLNLFSITPEEEQELMTIKQKYGVNDPDQELWKVLLSQKLKAVDAFVLYETIKKVTGDENTFVQFDHFRNNWLNPGSKLLIPRKRKHFRLICEYLGLSKAYYRLKLKKRASMTSNSRQSNAQMNALLAQMINEGLFEKEVDWDGINLDHLMEEHELEEKGITQENLVTELNALVDLLRDKILLKDILKLELS